MKITVLGKQMRVRESLVELIEKKLAKFDRFFGEDTEATVTCRVRKNAKIIEITVAYAEAVFRAEEESYLDTREGLTPAPQSNSYIE